MQQPHRSVLRNFSVHYLPRFAFTSLILLGPVGTIVPIQCHYLAVCPRGSKSANKFLILVFFAAFMVLVWIVFKIMARLEFLRNLKIQSKLPELQLDNEAKKMKNLGKQFNITFENLTLTLPNNLTVVSNVSGELRSGRTCAVMGPSGSGKTT